MQNMFWNILKNCAKFIDFSVYSNSCCWRWTQSIFYITRYHYIVLQSGEEDRNKFFLSFTILFFSFFKFYKSRRFALVERFLIFCYTNQQKFQNEKNVLFECFCRNKTLKIKFTFLPSAKLLIATAITNSSKQHFMVTICQTLPIRTDHTIFQNGGLSAIPEIINSNIDRIRNSSLTACGRLSVGKRWLDYCAIIFTII